MTNPSTSDKESKDQKNQKRLGKMVGGVVAPILFAIAIIIGFDVFNLNDEFEFPRLDTFPDQLLEPHGITESTNLFGLGMKLHNEISLIEDIYSKVNMRCVNMNWYGEEYSKRQIFYNDSVFELQVLLQELLYEKDEIPTEDTFIQLITNPISELYVEVNCPHVSNIYEVPSQYDPEFKGMTAFFACNNHPFFSNKMYCNYLPKEPLTT